MATTRRPEFEPVYAEREAVPALAGLVRRLWYLKVPTPGQIERILPIPYVHAIVNLGDPYTVLRQGEREVNLEFAGAFVSGLQSTYLVNRNPPVLHHVGAELEPYAWRALGSHPFADDVRDAEASIPALAAVRDAALASAGPEGALDALQEALVGSLTPAALDPVAAAVAREIESDPGMPIAQVAARVGASPSSLASRFRRATGVTPKRHADVHRFHRFLAELARPGELPTWTELVAATDYYDQPHFIRSFVRFAGVSPKQYLKDLGEVGRASPAFVATPGE